MNQQASIDFGMIGLGTMGRNLLLNITDKGFTATGFDKDLSKGGVPTLQEFVSSLKKPRKIMMLVPAGPIVDAVIKDLLPLVEPVDIIIDGGNSYYKDTLRRIGELQSKNIHFMGMGVSGGEQGARTGPSIMPGGDQEAWEAVKPILEAVSAKVNGDPCVAYMGKGAAGHYVKMVHNGIEYAIMQLISEVYDILKRGLSINNKELHDIFNKWNEGEMRSFLMEITAEVFTKQDEGSENSLVDLILDKAGSKGTGKWTSQDAMDIPVSIPTIDIAVAMRDLSVYKDERVKASELYKHSVKPLKGNWNRIIDQVHDGLYAATIICYAQGLTMLQKASAAMDMQVPLQDVVRIWRGGCIIRSALLEVFLSAFQKEKDLANILLNKKVAAILKKKTNALRKVIQLAINARVPVTGLSSALGYLDAYTSEKMPVNLIQAQRDLFGAHGYQRIDKEGNFHSEWTH